MRVSTIETREDGELKRHRQHCTVRATFDAISRSLWVGIVSEWRAAAYQQHVTCSAFIDSGKYWQVNRFYIVENNPVASGNHLLYYFLLGVTHGTQKKLLQKVSQWVKTASLSTTTNNTTDWIEIQCIKLFNGRRPFNFRPENAKYSSTNVYVELYMD